MLFMGQDSIDFEPALFCRQTHFADVTIAKKDKRKMTIHEFGKKNDEIVVLIHPSAVMWDYCEYVIPLKEISFTHRLLIRMCDGFVNMKIVKIRIRDK
jgi:hypothetical protein